MRIALAQIMSGTDPRENLKLVEQYTYAAAQAGSKLVVFPEGTMCRFGVPLTPVAEPLDGPWADEVRSIAARYGITVLAGMFTPAEDVRVTNTMLATRSTCTTPSVSKNPTPLHPARNPSSSRSTAWESG